MKQNTKSLVAGGMVGATLMIAGSAFAAIPQEAKDAITAGDFAAFQVAVEGTRAANLPEEVFDLKVDLYEAKAAEDEDAITEIKAELKEYKEEQKAERQELRADRQTTIEAGDYDAFVALVSEGREVPSEQVFNLLGDLYEAKDAEDQDEAEAIKAELSELGFEKKAKKGKRGFGNKGDRSDR